MIPAFDMVILPQNLSTGNGHVPGCSCILSVALPFDGGNPTPVTTDVTSEFSKIRFNIDPNNDHTGLRNWGSANSVQVAELAMYNGDTKLTSGVATNPGGNMPAAEGAGKLIDGNTGTKWYVGIQIDSVGLNGLSCSTLLFGLRCEYLWQA